MFDKYMCETKMKNKDQIKKLVCTLMSENCTFCVTCCAKCVCSCTFVLEVA